jgi:ribosomal protein S18 acetylase RimI-like enzyme
MGLEGLRRSKLSYYPTLLWPKTTALRLSDEQRACKALWQKVFGDEEAFVDRFLIHHFRSDRMLRIEEDCAEPSTLTNPKNRKLLSMLHLLPFRTEEGEHVGYIYGVATTPEARGRGLATRLLQEAIQRAQAEGMKALILIPADDQVRAFYARHGFSGEVPVRLLATNDFDFGTGTPDHDRAMVLPLSAEFSTPTELELHKD